MTLAFKGEQKFQSKATIALPDFTRPPVSSSCHEWSLDDLENLQRQMSRYVHSVVYSDEFAVEESNNRKSHSKKKQTQSELRDVFTVFIQPKLKVDLNAEENFRDSDTLELLNSILFIVNSEVNHFKAHLRQFIVDDKGLVIIANFGLRGSTYPNMIEERAIPCVTNIKTLLKTELDLECKMGATYGKAFCGTVGGKSRHEYAILGPSVNLAARLMASASNPGILVDEQVKLKAGERPFSALAPVKAKGYDNLVKIYNPAESVRKAWRNVSQEFVGRQEEIESLLTLAESVSSDQGNAQSTAVFVSGPYGIGKSYVLSQAAQEIEKSAKNQGHPYHISRYVFCEEDSFQPFR
jgi:class 3 adenylate cyclase